MKRSRIVLVLVAAALALASFFAFAREDDRAVAEQTIAELEKDAHTKELCADPIAKARTALERGHRMHVAGDDKHARLAEGLALEWTRVAQELARADAVETRAAAARAQATDEGVHVERERATLEQQLAENGRLQAELAKIESGKDASAPAPLARDGGTK